MIMSNFFTAVWIVGKPRMVLVMFAFGRSPSSSSASQAGLMLSKHTSREQGS